ncbi:hypothetical protein Lser_V15G38288 [Lactuca serriola]
MSSMWIFPVKTMSVVKAFVLSRCFLDHIFLLSSFFPKFNNLPLLNLFRNKLHGSIPDFVSELPELEVLQLWENNFIRRIPQGLGKNGKL